MRILLICNAGTSTSLLMKKLEKWGSSTHNEIVVKATSFATYFDEDLSQFDCFLLGPQIGFRLEEIKEGIKLPGAVIPAADYALSNCEAIYKLAKNLVK